MRDKEYNLYVPRQPITGLEKCHTDRYQMSDIRQTTINMKKASVLRTAALERYDKIDKRLFQLILLYSLALF